MYSTNDIRDRYWRDADWLPPGHILDHWCQQDARYRQALLSACERGTVNYRPERRQDLRQSHPRFSARGILLIKRDSFDAWGTTLEGKNPLPTSNRPVTAVPTGFGLTTHGHYRLNQCGQSQALLASVEESFCFSLTPSG
jgi:hypothetical protein